jgi:1-acyl-sn-glycerol-3-phosphate acyltransferase
MKLLTKWEKALSGFALLVFIVDAILCFMRHEIFGGVVSLFLGISIVWNVVVVAIARKETKNLEKLQKENVIVVEN